MEPETERLGSIFIMRKLIFFICFIYICGFSVFGETRDATATMETATILSRVSSEVNTKTGYVLFIIPQYNFPDDEYTIPKVMISRAGYTVEVASTSTKELALGTDIIKVRPNLTVEQINVDKYDAVVMVGGYLSKKFYENKALIDKVTQFKAKGKLICAMDNIPMYLAKWGLLKDVKVTVHPALAKDIKKMGINYVEKDIVMDKNFITVNIYKYSDAFAGEVINELNKR
jgi:putative intracellular protease/amidase